MGQKDFAGAQLLSQLYGKALAAKGFKVSYKNLGPTEVHHFKVHGDNPLRSRVNL